MVRLKTCSEFALFNQQLFLALGVFDGIHRGHAEVIGAAIRMARRAGGLAGVVTFEPHPIQVLAAERAPSRLLASLDHKARLLAGLGVDFLLAIDFTEEFAQTSAEEFLSSLLASGKVHGMSVGQDWRFGRERKGDVEMLGREAEKRGFLFCAASPVLHAGERISSTRIRKAISAGRLADAAAMLGRAYAVEGLVVKGQQMGRTLGFPTANVALGDEQLPPDGVWGVRVRCGNDRMCGVANLGFRPTVHGTARVLEAHLFDFSGDLYGKRIECEFVRHLREERKFPSLDALCEQIHLDRDAAKQCFAEESSA
jgi:riboflavin kinase/FMN adenylyltransferase